MQKLTWKEVENIADDLAKKITASGFKPDYIIGVTTGGLIPLYLLSKRLGIEKILTVSASVYDKKRNRNLRITYLPEIDLSGKRVLLVDEIVETGGTLKEISKVIVEKYGVKKIKTATFAANTDRCESYPDFWEVEQSGEWVMFPWEKKEDFPKYSFQQRST